jgi:hypothetical protein
LQEPDHTAAYGIGFQRAWTTRHGAIYAVRGELMNFEVPSIARSGREGEGLIYLHYQRRQGHTHRGQLLGAGFGAGSGAGASVQVERYTRDGLETVRWSRLVRYENPPVTGTVATDRCSKTCLDVQHVLRVTRVRTYKGIDVTYGLNAVYELNRDFRGDAFNFSPEVDIRWRP